MRPSGAESASVGAAASGLRERSKARRRAAIQRTAMRLFAERGYEGTTLADIADDAEVAVRTVTGYFGSKAELATSWADDIAARLTAAFADHPGTDIADIIDIWLAREEGLLDPETSALAFAMYEANPQVQALGSSHIAAAAEQGRAALAGEIGLPADHPMTAITGAAVGAALGSYLSAMAHHGLSPGLHQAFMRYLRASIGAARPA